MLGLSLKSFSFLLISLAPQLYAFIIYKRSMGPVNLKHDSHAQAMLWNDFKFLENNFSPGNVIILSPEEDEVDGVSRKSRDLESQSFLERMVDSVNENADCLNNFDPIRNNFNSFDFRKRLSNLEPVSLNLMNTLVKTIKSDGALQGLEKTQGKIRNLKLKVNSSQFLERLLS